MKTLSQILETVKEEFSKRLYDIGLCAALPRAYDKGKLTGNEFAKFYKYYHRSIRSKKIFYDYRGIKTYERNQFAWPMDDSKSRIKWLDRNIVRLMAIENGLVPNKVYQNHAGKKVKLLGCARARKKTLVILKPASSGFEDMLHFNPKCSSNNYPTIMNEKSFGFLLSLFKYSYKPA